MTLGQRPIPWIPVLFKSHIARRLKIDFRLYTWWQSGIPLRLERGVLGEGNREIPTFLPSDWAFSKGEAGFICFNRVAAAGLLKTKPGWVFRFLISMAQKQFGLSCGMSAQKGHPENRSGCPWTCSPRCLLLASFVISGQVMLLAVLCSPKKEGRLHSYFPLHVSGQTPFPLDQLQPAEDVDLTCL